MKLKYKLIGGAVAVFSLLSLSYCGLTGGRSSGEHVGSVTTALNSYGFTASDKIKVEAIDDPKVSGVVCVFARAQKGGINGMLGIAEDPSEVSIDCKQNGPIDLKVVEGLSQGEKVLSESANIYFKTIYIVRFYDPKRKIITYLSYSTKLIDGSPKNNVSMVAIRKWD
jgi:CreA protein